MKYPFDRIGRILPPHAAVDVIVRQQQLGDFDAVPFEGRGIHAHKFRLACRGTGLFAGKIFRSLVEAQHVDARRDRRTADDDARVSVLDEGSNLGCEATKLPSIKGPPAGAREHPGPKLDYNSSHKAVDR